MRREKIEKFGIFRGNFPKPKPKSNIADPTQPEPQKIDPTQPGSKMAFQQTFFFKPKF